MKRLPPLNALRAFEAAARHLSFSRAADELSVTPGAVSQQIKALEDFVGAPVFRREKKGLLLTDAAQQSLPALRDAFRLLEEASGRLTAGRDGGKLAISVAPSLASKWLVPRLDSFHAAHPDIDVWINADMSVVDFAVDDVDLAIRYGAGRYPGLAVDLLMNETIVPVCSPALLKGEHALHEPEDLDGVTLLHDGSPDNDETCPTWSMWLKAAGVQGVDGTRGPVFNQSSLVIEAAVAGRGVALAKSALAESDLAAGRLVVAFDVATPIAFAYHLVRPPAHDSNPAVRAFMDWVKGEAG